MLGAPLLALHAQDGAAPTAKPVKARDAKAKSSATSTSTATSGTTSTSAKPKKAVSNAVANTNAPSASPVTTESTPATTSAPSGEVDSKGRASGSVKLSEFDRKKLEEEVRRAKMSEDAVTKEKQMLNRQNVADEMKNPSVKERKSIPSRF